MFCPSAFPTILINRFSLWVSFLGLSRHTIHLQGTRCRLYRFEVYDMLLEQFDEEGPFTGLIEPLLVGYSRSHSMLLFTTTGQHWLSWCPLSQNRAMVRGTLSCAARFSTHHGAGLNLLLTLVCCWFCELTALFPL